MSSELVRLGMSDLASLSVRFRSLRPCDLRLGSRGYSREVEEFGLFLNSASEAL